MKKQWRTPIILSVLLVALILVWVGSTLLPGGTGTSDTTATTAELPIVYQADKDDVASIAVDNEQGSFTLLPRVVTEDGKTSIGWYVEGLEDLPLADTTIDSIVTVGTILYASKEISAGETNLAPFGPG